MDLFACDSSTKFVVNPPCGMTSGRISSLDRGPSGISSKVSTRQPALKVFELLDASSFEKRVAAQNLPEWLIFVLQQVSPRFGEPVERIDFGLSVFIDPSIS
jgi:hypothetical protein